MLRAPVNVPPSRSDARAWVEVDLAAVLENARTLARLSGTRLLPVVKADAYGTGAVAVSRALEAVDPWGFAVATIDEGCELRAAGVTRPILVLIPARPESFGDYQGAKLTATLGDGAAVHAWRGRGAAYHLEIDTGMNRTGVKWDAIGPLVDALDTPELEGAFTQLHSADRRDSSAATQLQRFREAVGSLRRRPALLHVANSAAALQGGDFAGDLARPGLFLYGGHAADWLPAPRPVVSLRARVCAVRRVAAGETVSYGGSWVAKGATTIATLPIGYADGLVRGLAAGGGQVLLRGRWCPVVGVVTMDFTMIDAGEGQVEMGDVATLIGADESNGARITLPEFASWSGLIQYQVLTNLGARLQRIHG